MSRRISGRRSFTAAFVVGFVLLVIGSAAAQPWTLGGGTPTAHVGSRGANAVDDQPSARMVAAGWDFTCALTSGGGVMCWGNNRGGMLGDGNSATFRLTPVSVAGLGSGVVATAAGFGHACALTAAGGVKCWGENELGQLGDGSNLARLTPADVFGLTSDVTAIGVGNRHTCALTTPGGVKCWGWNDSGWLGDGTTTTRQTPVDVSGLVSGVTSIAVGDFHTCALTSAGGVKCWGWNAFGQLGDGSTTTRLTPVDVPGLASGVAAITAGGYHACALTTARGVKCWGLNESGQLGDGTTTTRLTPVDVSGLSSGVAAIDAGLGQTCALTTAGGVKCWGRNDAGMVGDGTTIGRHTPVDVSGLASGAAAIAAGGVFTCALTTAAGIKCWGHNGYGALGDRTGTTRLTPVDVVGFQTRTLTVTKTGNGTGTEISSPIGIECGVLVDREICRHDFADGMSVTLSATAKPGSRFVGWSAPCSGTGPCTVKMDQNRSVTATFWTCLVPNVEGKPLATAKRAITRAHCSVGKVTKRSSPQVKSGRVVSQRPRADAKRALGTKIELVVSTGKRKHR